MNHCKYDCDRRSADDSLLIDQFQNIKKKINNKKRTSTRTEWSNSLSNGITREESPKLTKNSVRGEEGKSVYTFFFLSLLFFFFPFSPSFLLFFPPLSLSLFPSRFVAFLFFSYFPHCFAPFHSFTPLPRLSGRERARAVPGKEKGRKETRGRFSQGVCVFMRLEEVEATLTEGLRVGKGREKNLTQVPSQSSLRKNK